MCFASYCQCEFLYALLFLYSVWLLFTHIVSPITIPSAFYAPLSFKLSFRVSERVVPIPLHSSYHKNLYLLLKSLSPSPHHYLHVHIVIVSTPFRIFFSFTAPSLSNNPHLFLPSRTTIVLSFSYSFHILFLFCLPAPLWPRTISHDPSYVYVLRFQL